MAVLASLSVQNIIDVELDTGMEQAPALIPLERHVDGLYGQVVPSWEVFKEGVGIVFFRAMAPLLTTAQTFHSVGSFVSHTKYGVKNMRRILSISTESGKIP